jgi:uncharacterized protein (TIGR02301 family)
MLIGNADLSMLPKSVAIISGIIVLAAGMVAFAVTDSQLARAQNSAESGQQAEDGTEAPKIQTLPPAYDDQMLRLAEILGSLHYLRELCGADEGQLWRNQMEDMLAKEEPTEERRLQMIARFNRGFRGYREIYRECTSSAAEAANRFLRQGTRIAAEIPSRYGN